MKRLDLWSGEESDDSSDGGGLGTFGKCPGGGGRRNKMELLKRLHRNEEGQDIIEYGLLAAFISIVAIAAIQAIGPLVQGFFEDVEDGLGG